MYLDSVAECDPSIYLRKSSSLRINPTLPTFLLGTLNTASAKEGGI